MPTYAYRIVNVFVDSGSYTPRLTGNPLCVFVGGRVVELGRGEVAL
jgi:hypothetical protein